MKTTLDRKGKDGRTSARTQAYIATWAGTHDEAEGGVWELERTSSPRYASHKQREGRGGGDGEKQIQGGLQVGGRILRREWLRRVKYADLADENLVGRLQPLFSVPPSSRSMQK